MKKFSFKLTAVYLVFLFIPFLGEVVSSKGDIRKNYVKEDIWKKPEYTIIIPRSASEVLMEREGQYVYSGRDLDLGGLSGPQRKKVFIRLLIPAIDIVEKEVMWRRTLVEELSNKEDLNSEEEEYLEKLFTKYKVKDRNRDSLLSRLIMPPKSLIISQAALESGWGTSRFFREGNNIFGVWSYNKNEPRIAAMENREDGFTAYLKSYGDLKGSVEDYVMLLSKNNNYSELRSGIRNGESSMELAEHLIMYSELRGEYVKRVKSVIRGNKLNELDQ